MNMRHTLITTLLSLSNNTDFDFQQDDANFIDDGIEIEPFNLDQEREEGYFDESGNFVEFARGNDMKVLHFYFYRLGCFVWSYNRSIW